MPSRSRRLIVLGLIVLASLIGFVSTLTTWVNRQMLDADSWRGASEELVQDPEVRQAISVYLVDQLYANVDVGDALAERVPPNLKPVAGTVAGALREPLTDAVDRLLESPRLQALFVNASSLAQEKLVNVLEDNTGAGITTGDGVVTLDLGELVRALVTELGFSGNVLDRLPPDAGQLTVMRSDQLAAAQSGVRGVKSLSVWLLVLVLGLYALALFLARGARRETLRNIGCAWVLTGLAVLVARRAAGAYAVDALTQPSGEAPGKRTWLIGTSILGDIGWAVIVYGAAMIAGAVLAGPHAWARWVRDRIAPVLNESPGIAWAVVAAAFLVLVAWGPTHALRTLWGVALLAALIAAGVLALRSQTLAERAAGAAAPPPPAAGTQDAPA